MLVLAGPGPDQRAQLQRRGVGAEQAQAAHGPLLLRRTTIGQPAVEQGQDEGIQRSAIGVRLECGDQRMGRVERAPSQCREGRLHLLRIQPLPRHEDRLELVGIHPARRPERLRPGESRPEPVGRRVVIECRDGLVGPLQYLTPELLNRLRGGRGQALADESLTALAALGAEVVHGGVGQFPPGGSHRNQAGDGMAGMLVQPLPAPPGALDANLSSSIGTAALGDLTSARTSISSAQCSLLAAARMLSRMRSSE